MKTTIPISKKEICAFVLACKQLNIEYQSTKVSAEEFIGYGVIYKLPFDLFQLGTIFQIKCSRL